MTLRSFLIASTAALALAGCKAKPSQSYADQAAPASLVRSAAAPADAAAEAKPGQPAKPQTPAASPMLAYEYQYGLRAPADQVRPLLKKHEQACMAAGPSVCQVLGADASADRDEASGTLKLRAVDPWLSRFRDGLEGDAKAVGGEVKSSSVTTEDLTRSIVDTGADIRAKTMLRDRLEKLLAERPGKLSELLELEKTIADVQGEIDAAQSELAVMQQRVSMSTVTISYGSGGKAAGARAFAPLGQALTGFVGNTMQVVAALIAVFSYLLPLGLVGWLIWLGLRRWGPKPKPRPVAPPAAEKKP